MCRMYMNKYVDDVEDILFDSNIWLYNDIDPMDNGNDNDNDNDNENDIEPGPPLYIFSDGYYLDTRGQLFFIAEYNHYYQNEFFENRDPEDNVGGDEDDESEDEKLLVEDEPHLSNEVLHANECVIIIGSNPESHYYNNENVSTSLKELELNSDTTTNSTKIGLNSDITTNTDIGLNSDTTTNTEIGLNSNTTTSNVLELNPDTTINTGYGFMSGIDFVVMDCIIRNQPEQSVNGQPAVAQHTTDILAKSSNNKNFTE